MGDYIPHDSNNEGEIFIAQFESEEQNFQANLYCFQLTEGKGLTSLAVDHLTGG